MCSKLRIRVWCIGIRIPRTRQDGPNLYARLQALFPQRQSLELIEPISLSSAIDKRILQEDLLGGLMPDSYCAVLCPTGAAAIHRNIFVLIFQLPGVQSFVVQEFRVIVAFVKIFKDGRKDFGGFLWE